jgi:alpha-beta hydrolase superfamily lysophospholipase
MNGGFNMRNFILHAKDGVKLYSRVWDDVKKNSNIIVQIVHGMNDHVDRYDEIANFLNTKGIIVYAHDQRGHGRTAQSREEFGDFAKVNGWKKSVDDIHEMNKYIKTQYSDKLVVIFGHSMGSFLARSYMIYHGKTVNGAILCGTSYERKIRYKVAEQVVNFEIKMKGSDKRSRLVNQLIFGRYNNRFKPNKSHFDWLTTDEVEIEKIKNDPLKGGLYTNNFYKDFFGGLLDLSEGSKIDLIPKNIPYLFISGKDDPMAKKGKALIKLKDVYAGKNIHNVEINLCEGMRHEVHKERDRDIVFENIFFWIGKNYK